MEFEVALKNAVNNTVAEMGVERVKQMTAFTNWRRPGGGGGGVNTIGQNDSIREYAI